MADTPKYQTPEEMQKAIDTYFLLCDTNTSTRQLEDGSSVVVEDPARYTITGLALALGFESRQSLYDYEKKAGFSYSIKRAKLKIENQVESEVRTSKNAAGPIFILKNFGWQDKVDVEHSGGVNIIRLPAKKPEGAPIE